MSNQAIKNLLLTIVGAALFTLPAFYNGYPFVTSDTGAYIDSGFRFCLPRDRPVFYGIFLRLFSFNFSFWIPIIIQGLLLSFLLLQLCKNLLLGGGYQLIILLVIGVFTSAGWFSCQIMPDIFTSLLFLAAINYHFEKSFSRKVVLLCITALSILVHNSNLAIAIVFFLLLGGTSVFVKTSFINPGRTIHLLLLVIFCWITQSTLNWVNGYGFTPNRSTHVFLMGKLVENGIAKKYLEENCTTNHYQLCNYKDQLYGHAWDFVWSPESPLYKTGGWDSSKTEYEKIIYATLTTPKYLVLNVKESIRATRQQLVLCGIGDGLWSYLEDSSPYNNIFGHLHREFPRYVKSKQNIVGYPFDLLNRYYLYSCLTIVLLFLCSWIISRTIEGDLLLLLLASVIFVLINAFVTASLANVLTRLNARDIFLIPATCFIVSCFVSKKSYAVR